MIVLRYWHQLSERETAYALGNSVGTVKSQTSKALARLRADLATDLLPVARTAADRGTGGTMTDTELIEELRWALDEALGQTSGYVMRTTFEPSPGATTITWLDPLTGGHLAGVPGQRVEPGDGGGAR